MTRRMIVCIPNYREIHFSRDQGNLENANGVGGNSFPLCLAGSEFLLMNHCGFIMFREFNIGVMCDWRSKERC